MVTRSDVKQFLQANPPAETFSPYCHISKEADTLTVYFKEDGDYSKRLSDHVTLYLSLEDNEIVGCRIKGISGILEDLPNYIRVSHGKIELGLVFLAFRGGADDDISKAMNDLACVASEGNMILESCP